MRSAIDSGSITQDQPASQTVSVYISGETVVEYAPVVGFPQYRVGKDGSIWRFYSGDLINCSRNRQPKWKRLMARPDTYGYMRITLSSAGKKTTRKVHRIVLDAFVGKRPVGMMCRHLDGNKENNTLTNLCWGTNEENCADKRLHGTLPIGSRVGTSKLTERDVEIIIRLLWAGVSTIKIATAFGVNDATICGIANSKTWKHLTAEIGKLDAYTA